MFDMKAYLNRVGYQIIVLLTLIYEWWKSLKLQVSKHATNLVGSVPVIRSFNARRPPASGSRPKDPSILGVVIVEEMSGNQQIQALARLLTWAQFHKFEQVFIYEPSGALIKHSYSDIQQQMHWVDPHDNLALWVGWRPPPGIQGKMGVALLSGADAEWPMVKLAENARKSAEEERAKKEAAASVDDREDQEANAVDSTRKGKENTIHSTDAAASAVEEAVRKQELDKAIAAPQRLKKLLVEVAGPLAGMEPDFVMVFGEVLTLGGFPPWTVRVSEVYHVGMLTAVTHSKLDAVLRKFKGTKQRFGK